jgi:glycosyltransferase involved in cell wall biosynthesis
MSSGLVPVTNLVAAIPEFLDSNCGFLVEAEDAIGLASSILEMYKYPKLFEKLSKGAADRVRRQSDFKICIDKEITLIYDK